MSHTSLPSSISDILLEEGHHNPRLENPSLAAPAQKALLGIQHLANAGTIEASLQELVKIRASQINGCAYCLAMHWRDALKAGERVDRLATLIAWRESDWFTPRERVAMAWTEALTNLPTHCVSDDLYSTCRTVFSEQEMVDLTVCIVAINSWNRIAIGFSSRPEPFDYDEAQ